MATIRIENFTGMMPSRAPALLPDNVAYYAQNTWLYHGDMRTYRQTQKLHTLDNPDAKSVYRIPNGYNLDGTENSIWMEFDDPFTTVFRAPMVNDKWDRYYLFAPSTAPKYNTLDRIIVGAPWFLLGVPAPDSAPDVTTTGTAVNVTRAYLYTWETEYGEEGPPSPAVVKTGDIGGTWTINIPPIPAFNTADRNIKWVNVYRTIANGDGTATFYRLTRFAVNTATPYTYVDNRHDTDISGAPQFQSTLWTTPPSNLEGVRVMPNGMVIGWTKQNEIWFCEPYRPHAWPSAYTISVDHPIVGLGHSGQSFAVLTEGEPYVGTGVHPSTVALSATSIKEPCLSRGSIVSTEQGVYYASRNGLILLGWGSAVAQISTAQIFSRQDWAALQPQLFMGSRLADAYIAFVQRGILIGGVVYDGKILPGTDGDAPDDGLEFDGETGGEILDGLHTEFKPLQDSDDNGFVLGGAMPNTTFVRLKFPGLIANVLQDDLSGETYIIADGAVYQWDAVEAPYSTPYTWVSKLFQFPKPQAFIAAKVFFDVPSSVAITPPTEASRNTDQGQVYDNTKQYLLLRVLAGGKTILTREVVKSGELILIPAGQKYDFWQFKLEGQVAVRNIQVATSVKELAAT